MQTSNETEIEKPTLEDIRVALAEVVKAHKEAEVRFRKTEEAIAGLAAQQKASDERLEKSLGKLGGRLGEVAEHLLTPGLTKKFRDFGFTFDNSALRRKFYDPNTGKCYAEVDAFLENGDSVMAVEVKTKLTNDDIDEQSERLEEVRKYAGLKGDKRTFYGAVAGTIVSESVKKYALRQGFYVVEPSGEDIIISEPATKNTAK